METKFCKFCGAQIPKDAVVCTACGHQVEELHSAAQPNIVINNTNTNTNVNRNTNTNAVHVTGKPKNKWVAFALCICLGFVGAHKFYECKIGMGILYACTMGLFMIGRIVDIFAILAKPNPYYV